VLVQFADLANSDVDDVTRHILALLPPTKRISTIFIAPSIIHTHPSPQTDLHLSLSLPPDAHIMKPFTIFHAATPLIQQARAQSNHTLTSRSLCMAYCAL